MSAAHPDGFLLPADPRASYLAHREEIDAALSAALARGGYILGEEVRAFEREFAAWLGAASAAGVASGTDALVLALRACGIGPGDTVFTVSHTAVATVAAVEQAGAECVLVDIDAAAYTIDPDRLDAAARADSGIGRRAVIAVHLYGQPADLDALADVARRREFVLIEDCAQSHGAAWRGRKTGTFGPAAAFSFYPTKNLGALGDGGAVATSDAGVLERLRLLREYGWRERYVSEIPGTNSRLDELQAAILRVFLRHLDAGNARRAAIAERYGRELAGLGLGVPAVRPHATHVWHQYVVRSPERDALRERLRARGVGTLVHYPVPVHLQPAYRGRLRTGPGGLAESERAAREVLSLPMHPGLSDADVARVVAACGP